MSKGKTLSAIISALFPNSEKAISENMSTEDHTSFSEDVNELNARLEAQEEANALVVADLATANSEINELRAALTTSQESLVAAESQLAAVTDELEKFGENTEARDSFLETATTNASFVTALKGVGITSLEDTTTGAQSDSKKSYEKAPWNQAAVEKREAGK